MHIILDYLINRKQRAKIGCHYSSRKEPFFGVPQGSSLGPLLFNIHLCDQVLLTSQIDIASYVDDTTRYVYGENISSVIESLGKSDLLS